MSILNAAVELDSPGTVLTRKQGRFYKKRVKIESVQEIWAVNRNALTYDEILIFLRDEAGHDFQMTEFDAGFAAVMMVLAAKFPGVENWRSVEQGAPLMERHLLLYKKR